MWEYHTDVKPTKGPTKGIATRSSRDQTRDQTRDQARSKHKDAMNLAYRTFFDEIVGNVGDIGAKGGKYCMVIETQGNDDIINTSSDYHVRFTKSKFLGTQRLQRDLVRKYKPLGVYVDNPEQQENLSWFIVFSPSRNKARSNRPRQRETTHSAQSE